MSVPQKVKYRTKRERRMRSLLVKAAVSAFLVLFIASVLGVVLTLQR